jgi:hypothetical protein
MAVSKLSSGIDPIEIGLMARAEAIWVILDRADQIKILSEYVLALLYESPRYWTHVMKFERYGR